jgi:hypothetical protein
MDGVPEAVAKRASIPSSHILAMPPVHEILELLGCAQTAKDGCAKAPCKKPRYARPLEAQSTGAHRDLTNQTCTLRHCSPPTDACSEQ